MKIKRGIYGFPPTGILTNKLLKKRLAKHDFYKVPRTTPDLLFQKTRRIWFTLVDGHFGVDCVGKEHIIYLTSILK